MHDAISATTVVRDALVDIATARASLVAGALADLARELAVTLQDTARDLGFTDGNDEEADLTSVLREMPKLDPGTWDVRIAPSFRLKLSVRMEAREVEQRLREQIGRTVTKAFYNFGKMLDVWARRTLNEIQLLFDTQADKYRAHLDRLGSKRRASETEQVAIRRDLARLLQLQDNASAEMPPAL